MSMSWSERAARRGGITESEFLAEMRKEGFRVVATPLDLLWQFEHADTGTRRYVVRSRPIEPFSKALERLTAERNAQLRHRA